jgi:serine/threonine-protein kinase
VTATGPGGPLAPGQELGRFRLERDLGNAQAWAAVDGTTGARVTLERVPEASPEALRAWREDRRRLASLGDPRLPATTAEVEVAGTHFAVGPPWGDEASLSFPSGTRARSATLEWTRAAARALAAAHRAGVVHGDLRPEDVRRTVRGVQLVRFGAWRAQPPVSPLHGTATADVDALLAIAERWLERQGGLGELAPLVAARLAEPPVAVSAAAVIATLESAAGSRVPTAAIAIAAGLLATGLAVGIGLSRPAEPRPPAVAGGTAATSSEPAAGSFRPRARPDPPPLPMPAVVPLDPPVVPAAGDALVGRWQCAHEGQAKLTREVVYEANGLFQSHSPLAECDGTWRATGTGAWRQTGNCLTRRGRSRALLSELRLDALGRTRVHDAGVYGAWTCRREP